MITNALWDIGPEKAGRLCWPLWLTGYAAFAAVL
jgi:hypothetical protein